MDIFKDWTNISHQILERLFVALRLKKAGGAEASTASQGCFPLTLSKNWTQRETSKSPTAQQQMRPVRERQRLADRSHVVCLLRGNTRIKLPADVSLCHSQTQLHGVFLKAASHLATL